MALKVLMLRRDRDRLNKELEALRADDEKFTAKRTELENAINELTDEATQEQREAVESEIAKFEKDEKAHKERKDELEDKVREIEEEIKAEEEAQPAADEAGKAEDNGDEKKDEERKVTKPMQTRTKFYGMNEMETRAMFEREDVKSFIETVRGALGNKRAIEGGGLLIPEVFLGLIRENIENYSKLYKHVNVRQINGNGTVVVMGTIPEAVWTDCCANLNELDLTFNDAEVACWRVGGYFDICNATLEDSDIDLAAELLTVLGQAIGLAIDKAILFGLGTRMPMGVFTRLAQETAPADYPATARPWEDLHETNILTIADTVTGIDLFKAFLVDSGAAKGKYSRGEKVWVMNETTHTQIVAAGMSIDANGAIVAGINGAMPVVGGIIEVLNFIPDDVIIGGYFDLYLLAERAGTRLDQSEHVHFIQDRTVFRGTARYDGLPVIAEGFVAIGINGTTPSADEITFAPDTANA